VINSKLLFIGGGVHVEKTVQYTDLSGMQDDITVLRNPHKGWYWHYIDNGVVRGAYRDKTPPGDYLLDFPGLNHLYLRIDWSDVQPEPDRFDWSYIDQIMDEWGKMGYRFSFRVCSYETNDKQTYAAPEWLIQKGCKGKYFPMPRSGGQLWEPDYGDPVYLYYLEQFMAVFAAKFDNDPRVEFVDWGSYGTWGEGHTGWGSQKSWPVEDMKKHVDIHVKYFKNKPILVNDDHFNSRVDDTQENNKILLDYCIEKGLGLRDDSICVAGYAARYGYDTLRTGWMFDLFWKQAPIDIEFEHFHVVKPEVFKSGYPFLESLLRTHATYAGFHGYPRPWLEKYYDLTEYLANRLGYWYFLNGIRMPEYITAGTPSFIEFLWQNRGIGLGYNRYKLFIRLTNTNDQTQIIQCLDESDNRKWMPGEEIWERLKVHIPSDAKPGEYNVAIALFEYNGEKKTAIRLGFKSEFPDKDGFYTIAKIAIR